ncbi:MAG: hypothetical protein SGILL_002402 [Bacillariaceae sp.]
MSTIISVQNDAAQRCDTAVNLPQQSAMRGDSAKLKLENKHLKATQERLEQQVQQLQLQVQNMNKTVSLHPTPYKNKEKEDQMLQQTRDLEDKVKKLTEEVQDYKKKSEEHQSQSQQEQQSKDKRKTEERIFPKSIEKLMVDYATIPRDEFNQVMDIGVPYDDTNNGADEVVILYTKDKAKPSHHSETTRYRMNATQAMENCNVVKVILQQRHDFRRPGVQQCLAIVPNWDSFYVHNFMRLKQQKSRIGVKGEQMLSPDEKVNLTYPLRYVSRSYEDDGSSFEGVPLTKEHTKPHYKALNNYYQSFTRISASVQDVIKQRVTFYNDTGITQNNKQTLVVMTVNKGQSVLFHNFVCHSQKRGIDLKNILMFATDEYSYNLSKSLGVPAFYDEEIFGAMPETAAGEYGDQVFARMMLAKVICVHLGLYSGYNVLFQDVDVLWFKNPLTYLQSPELEEWDMVFQDDGSRQTRFRPYSANSGFYFVRNNEITRFFFSTLLRMGDVMTTDGSHQTVLVSLINEFASWKGLRVKVFSHGVDNPFPGGVEFHRVWCREMFYKMFEENVYPYIFHMSWTFNMEDKLNHYQQLGMWYLPDDTSTCSGRDCCLAESNFKCSYQDKPSMLPCPNATLVDGHRGTPFWPRPEKAT